MRLHIREDRGERRTYSNFSCIHGNLNAPTFRVYVKGTHNKQRCILEIHKSSFDLEQGETNMKQSFVYVREAKTNYDNDNWLRPPTFGLIEEDTLV